MNSVKQSPDLLLVIGMHRSGTSALTRGLSVLGCTLGENLIEAIPDNNDKGFWEDADINAFNQELLVLTGSDWWHLMQYNADFFRAPIFIPYRLTARTLLSRKIVAGRTLALKEPRMTLLLPFWQDIFDEMGLQVGYVHAVRHPLDVAYSLLRRDGFSHERSLLLWFFYHESAIKCTLDKNYVVVHYDRLLDQTSRQLERIVQTLHFPVFDEQSAAFTEYANTFLDRQLRHSTYAKNKQHSKELRASYPPVERLYNALEAASRDEPIDFAVLLNQLIESENHTKIYYRMIQELQFENNKCKVEVQLLECDLQTQYKNHEEKVQTLEYDLKIQSSKHEAMVQRFEAESKKDHDSLEKNKRQIELLQEELKGVHEQRQQIQSELLAVYQSRSWRLTRPLRELWLRIPLSMAQRVRLKNLVLKNQHQDVLQLNAKTNNIRKTAIIHYVACRHNRSSVLPRSVRFIAFHLPQYHEIPENNQWWGKGFTEWSNVQPALPQFDSHYQPHVPMQGYYDLSDDNAATLVQQARLAKNYGIEGFCFYFYWFAGHRLLEKPLELLLANPDWDVPFCLCWANENWTRRWDGLDADVLIAQDHSAADDLAFITYVHRYLRDPRYLRVNGRPIILLYRPDLLPNAQQTIELWRSYCRDVGLGEIFVIYPQSFENRDPREYGMDAATEFPPNNSAPPELDAHDYGVNSDFNGKIYDWSIFPERAKNYPSTDYKKFLGLNPGWDNTPRRKSSASIFLNNDTLGYQEWAYRATRNTCEQFSEPDERLIFINAWNEWGEGAHLEPDLRSGCAYLEATDMAQLRTSVELELLPKYSKTAIVIHAFYPDILSELMPQLQTLSIEDWVLWVTTPEDKQQEVSSILASLHCQKKIIAVPNRGRDVLPFLTILPELMEDDIGFVLKLHTKKSKHRSDGAAWRQGFFKELVNSDNLNKWRTAMQEDKSLGMVAPKEYVVPMSLFWGNNKEKTTAIANRLGLHEFLLSKIYFVAGTMFFCRREVLLPILALDFQQEQFEEELGQIDGTMAHSVERAFGMAVSILGMRIMGI